jgi:nucleotide-binding universal stress UspA family protein
MILLDSVLVAFDFSDTSISALTYGENLARAFGSRLHVLHVADVIATSAAQFYPEGPGDPEVKATELAMNQLRTFLSGDADGPAATPAVRLSRSPADEIVRYAREIHADIIVAGTHGRGGMSRLLMGSVAEHVVRNAPCPVLVVRPREHEFVMPDPVNTSMRIPR